MMYEHFRKTGATFSGDDVLAFDTRWDEVYVSNHKMPSDSILESLHKMRIRESDQLKTALALHERDIEQNIMPWHFWILPTNSEKLHMETTSNVLTPGGMKFNCQPRRYSGRHSGVLGQNAISWV